MLPMVIGRNGSGEGHYRPAPLASEQQLSEQGCGRHHCDGQGDVSGRQKSNLAECHGHLLFCFQPISSSRLGAGDGKRKPPHAVSASARHNYHSQPGPLGGLSTLEQ